MKVKTHIIAYMITVIWDLLIAWPLVLLVRAAWGTNLHWETPPALIPGGPALACVLREGSWAARVFYRWRAVTLGHAIIYNWGEIEAGGWKPVQSHEHRHVEQFEVAMLMSFFAALISLSSGFVAFFPIWVSGFLLMVVSSWLVAVIRGENIYSGSMHEEGARAPEEH
jgi:hypothetical protein